MSQGFYMERQADDAIDGFLRRFKSQLLPAARLCLLSTFIEDGVRMLVGGCRAAAGERAAKEERTKTTLKKLVPLLSLSLSLSLSLFLYRFLSHTHTHTYTHTPSIALWTVKLL